MLPRTLFEPDHDLFRQSVRAFVAREIAPYHDAWEEDGMVPRALWTKAGAAGMLCCTVAENYGGPGCDFRFNVVVTEETGGAGYSGPGFSVHSDMAATYIENYGSEPQKRRWLPSMVRGETICAIAMTEPDAGSDLQAMRTAARQEGDTLIIQGQKTYISNGQLCDLIVLACKTDTQKAGDGISLVLVEADRPGVRKGRNLKKLGMHAQDTSELFFEEVRVPRENLLGEEGAGFRYLKERLAQERLVQAVRSAASVRTMIDQTVAYTQARQVFGRTVAAFQNTRFTLAELEARLAAAQTFVDRCAELHLEGQLDATTSAALKLVVTELHGEAADACLQLHGGMGYMWETPITRAFADARAARIAAGSVEIMKELVARRLFRSR